MRVGVRNIQARRSATALRHIAYSLGIFRTFLVPPARLLCDAIACFSWVDAMDAAFPLVFTRVTSGGLASSTALQQSPKQANHKAMRALDKAAR
jgi:hypothetical protein